MFGKKNTLSNIIIIMLYYTLIYYTTLQFSLINFFRHGYMYIYILIRIKLVQDQE